MHDPQQKINEFRTSGLYTWNPSSIPEEAFAPFISIELTAAQLSTKENLVTVSNSPESIKLLNRTFNSDITFCEEDGSTA